MEAWNHEQFVDSVGRFKRAWVGMLDSLDLRVVGFWDIVSQIDPDFQTPCSAQSPPVPFAIEQRGTSAQFVIVCRMHERFLAHPQTKKLESPYSILLEIINNCGSFSKEHGFIDFHDQNCHSVGALYLARANKSNNNPNAG